MSYIPIGRFLPDIAYKESKKIKITEDYFGIKKGEYVLLEMYCNDLNCDCRRVFLEVISCDLCESIATIAYGWESSKFYANWFRITKEDKRYKSTINSLKGPILNDASKQSKYAPAMLNIISNYILTDTKYVEGLKRHYKLFKEMSDRYNKKIENIEPIIEIGRNDLCICGSGKKYKKCCGKNII
ncbi:MAG: SEC-C metal-binding domain-containing protein [Clostridia bacterium]